MIGGLIPTPKDLGQVAEDVGDHFINTAAQQTAAFLQQQAGPLAAGVEHMTADIGAQVSGQIKDAEAGLFSGAIGVMREFFSSLWRTRAVITVDFSERKQ